MDADDERPRNNEPEDQPSNDGQPDFDEVTSVTMLAQEEPSDESFELLAVLLLVWLTLQAELMQRNWRSDLRLEPADLATRTLFAFWKGGIQKRQFNPEKGDVPAYLKTITRNQAAQHRRKRRCLPVSAGERLDQAVDSSRFEQVASVLDQAVDSFRIEQVAAVLDRLSEADRQLIYARYFEGKKADAIAIELNATSAIVSQRLWRARERFRNVWEDLYGTDPPLGD